VGGVGMGVSASFRHGTYNGYGYHRCRCEACTAYQVERVRRGRQDRLMSGRLSHGTRGAYDDGCRCDACLLARAEAYRRSERA
jgi:hypothetical protein